MAGENGWLNSLAALYAMPEDHRDFSVGRPAALDVLRCDGPVLDLLVGAGLQCADIDGAQHFDRYDLFNLALASQSGRSLPEISMRYALRWMQGAPATWTEPLDWNFDVELGCPLGDGCGADPRWEHARLLPEATGGQLLSWQTEPTDVRVTDDVVRHSGPGPVRLAGSLRTCGELRTLRSQKLRYIVDEFLAHDYTWARMPETLQAQETRMLAAGVAPCIAASIFLEREFRAAGYEAITRRGWIMGVLDLAHSWVEVTDDDGMTKCVDVTFRKLTQYAHRPHPELAEACVGSRLNRLLPTSIPADGAMAGHRCGGVARTPLRKTTVRKIGRG
ncbi:hypothetical protein [Streptomyces sp. NBC_01275]|uniref:hypothetical protein n=1 Tax=Streptomyces sp. NBC_01275 TaxID=2903807 RepID=UPI0022529EAB|nr:hypothetical protein [Streptomyces sp. NBC_01275]